MSGDFSFPFVPESVTRAVESGRAHERADRIAGGRSDNPQGGVDPDYAPDPEFFESMSHDAIYAGAQSMRPGALSTHADKWHSVQAALDGMLLGYRLKIGGIIGSGWEGEGADAGRAAVDAFVGSGQRASEVMGSVKSRLQQAASAAEAVRAAVPPPEHVDTAAMLPLALLNPPSAAAMAAAQQRAEEARQEAIRAMNAIYKPAMIPVGNGVPTFAAPVDPTAGGGGAGAPGSGSGTGGGGGSSTRGLWSGPGVINQENATDGASNGQPDGAPGSADGSTAASDGSAASGSGSGGSDSGDQGDAAQTSAAATSSDSASGIAAGRPGGAGVGESGSNGAGYGAGGSGFGINGGAARRRDDRNDSASAGALGLGAVGGGAMGAPLGADAVRSGSSVAAGAAAAARSGMPGGVMPHGRNEKGEEDSVHETPGYLINVDNGNELVGEMPPAAPPVLGVSADE